MAAIEFNTSIDADYPKFTVDECGVSFWVNCESADGVAIVAHTADPTAIAYAKDVAGKLNAAIEDVGPRFVTDVHNFPTDSLGGVIASEIAQAAASRISV